MQFRTALLSATLSAVAAGTAKLSATVYTEPCKGPEESQGEGQPLSWEGEIGDESQCFTVENAQAYNAAIPDDGVGVPCSVNLYQGKNCEADDWNSVPAYGQCNTATFGSVKLSCKGEKEPGQASSSAEAGAKRGAAPAPTAPPRPRAALSLSIDMYTAQCSGEEGMTSESWSGQVGEESECFTVTEGTSTFHVSGTTDPACGMKYFYRGEDCSGYWDWENIDTSRADDCLNMLDTKSFKLSCKKGIDVPPQSQSSSAAEKRTVPTAGPRARSFM